MESESVLVNEKKAESGVEVDPEYRVMAQKENQPFTGMDAWQRRPPRCPQCDAILKATRRSVKVRSFNKVGYDTCMGENCKVKDHIIVAKSKVYRCRSDGCNNDQLYIGDPGEAVIQLRCKCPQEEDWNFTAMEIHLIQVHGMDKHDFLQHCFDNQRPLPLPVTRDQKIILLGPDPPDA